MSHFSKKEGNKRNSIIFMMLAFLLLFSVAVFAQTSNLHREYDLDNTKKMDAIKQGTNSDTSNLNFVLWFMGAKQDIDTVVLPIRTIEKKQFRTSGTAPSRLLIKIFLRKALGLENVIV